MNNQQIEKRDHRSDGHLAVHSIFHTIQGEGPFCGTPAVFIRLAGCNLKCPGCDTDYTSKRTIMSPRTILDIVHSEIGLSVTALVVITGGEPFRQNIRDLLYTLVESGFYVQIESNGTLEPPAIGYNLNPDQRRGVYVVCSPKTGGLHKRIYDVACALKYVVKHGCVHGADGLPLSALDHPSNPYPARPPIGWNRPVYVQPMDEQNPELNRLNYETAKESCLKFGHTLQLQIHKIIGVE